MPPNQENNSQTPLDTPVQPVAGSQQPETQPQLTSTPTNETVKQTQGATPLTPQVVVSNHSASINSAPSPSPTPTSYASQTPVQPASIYPEPQTGFVGTNPISRASLENVTNKRKKRTLRILLIMGAIFTLAIAVIFFLFITQPNFKAILLFKNYRSYTYSNAGSTFQLDYFKGSKIQKSSGNGTAGNVIVSPPLSNNALPIQLQISKPSTASQQAITQAQNCSVTGESMAFTVYVPAAGSNVNVCSLAVDNKPTIYLALFTGTNTQTFSIIVSQVYNQQEATSNVTYARQIVSKLGLSPYQKDLENFMASIKNK